MQAGAGLPDVLEGVEDIERMRRLGEVASRVRGEVIVTVGDNLDRLARIGFEAASCRLALCPLESELLGSERHVDALVERPEQLVALALERVHHDHRTATRVL